MSEREDALRQIQAVTTCPPPVCPELEALYNDVLAKMLDDPWHIIWDDDDNVVAQLVNAEVIVLLDNPMMRTRDPIRVPIGRYIVLVKNPTDNLDDVFQSLWGHRNAIVNIDGVLFCAESGADPIQLIRKVKPEAHDDLLRKFQTLAASIEDRLRLSDWSDVLYQAEE